LYLFLPHDIEFLKYPIGKPSIEEQLEDTRIEGCIAVIGEEELI
tara:strand:- start:251 stop:382 length:132 start_codon:yes stop_codon:yes gene_type:complete